VAMTVRKAGEEGGTNKKKKIYCLKASDALNGIEAWIESSY
jgi:hypothetical protein